MERNRKWWTLTAVALGVFVTTLDNTVVNVALPSIQSDLGIGRTALEWVVNGYILAFAALLLTGGKLADAFGRRLFLAGLAVFSGASVLGGFASGEELLIAARALQGAGAALLTPATLAIVSAAFPEKERGRAIAIWAAVSSFAFALGPVTGGLIAEHVHWSWIFFLNLPVGLVAMVLGRAAIEETRDASDGRRIDVRGLLASGGALLALTYALVESNAHGWSSPAIVGLLAAAAGGLALFAWIERRERVPMVDLSLFRSVRFAGANVLLLLFGFAIFGIYFFMSLYLQGVLGFSAVEAGLVFVPMAGLIVVGALPSTRLAERLGTAPVVAAGMALFALGLVLVSRLGETSSFAEVLPGLLVVGLGAALTTPLTATALASVPVERSGVASGILNTSREVAGALGIAVLGAILAAREGAALAGGATSQAAFVDGFSTALVIAAAVMAGGALLAAIILRRMRVMAASPLAQPAA